MSVVVAVHLGKIGENSNGKYVSPTGTCKATAAIVSFSAFWFILSLLFLLLHLCSIKSSNVFDVNTHGRMFSKITHPCNGQLQKGVKRK